MTNESNESPFWWGEAEEGMEAPKGYVLESGPGQFLICKRIADGKRFYAEVTEKKVVGILCEVLE